MCASQTVLQPGVVKFIGILDASQNEAAMIDDRKIRPVMFRVALSTRFNRGSLQPAMKSAVLRELQLDIIMASQAG